MLDEKYIQMTEHPVCRLTVKMTIPTMVTLLVTTFYNMVDTYFVGTVSAQATAGVGVTFSFMAILQALSFSLGHGTGTYVAKKLGAKNVEEAHEMAMVGFLTSIMLGVVIAIVGNCYVEELAHMLGSTSTIMPYTVSYLQYILLGAPFMMGGFVLSNHLRYQGNGMLGMKGMVTGALINIVLNPILIQGFGLGVGGAGIATLCSQIISFVILLIFVNHRGYVPIRFKMVYSLRRIYGEIIKCGFPTLSRQGLACVASICLNHQAGVFGDEAVAAMSIVTRFTMFAFSIVTGMGKGFQPVCGFNFGAKNYKRVKKAFRFVTLTTTVFLILVALTEYIWAEPLVQLFCNGDLKVVTMGVTALRYQCFVLPTLGIITTSSMLTQIIELPGRAAILSTARQFLFFMPILYLLTPTLKLQGVQLTQPLADVCAFIVAVPLAIDSIRCHLASELR